MIKVYTQGLARDTELFASVAKWALDAEVHAQIGMPVTGQDGDVWLVNFRNDKPVGFAQIRPMKNGAAHLRYLYSDSLPAKLELGRAAFTQAKALEAVTLYTNERTDSPVLPSLDFIKTKEHAKSKFARWERKIA